MAVKWLNTKFGRAHLFKNNPRTIRQGSFEKLAESVDAYPQFMVAQKIVVWKVPDKIDAEEGEKCPFVGQEGQLIVLSGNQRSKIMLAEGKDTIPDDWVCEAKGADGGWWPWRDAEVFLNVANNPEGIAGDFNYEVLQEKFDEFRMAVAGIDFSHFTKAMEEGTLNPAVNDESTDAVETDPVMGERNEDLDAFIAEREKTRTDLKEIDNFGFYLLVVFPDGFEQKCEFISKAKLFGGGVRVDKGNYLCLVFESYAQKQEFLNESGLEEEDPDTGVPATLFGLFCDGRALAKKMGIPLAETGLHFRDRIVDNQLAEMAIEPQPQKSEKEIAEEIYARLKAERQALGMSTKSQSERKRKPKDDGNGPGLVVLDQNEDESE